MYHFNLICVTFFTFKVKRSVFFFHLKHMVKIILPGIGKSDKNEKGQFMINKDIFSTSECLTFLFLT